MGPTTTSSRTCDNCRKRKIKCINADTPGSSDGRPMIPSKRSYEGDVGHSPAKRSYADPYASGSSQRAASVASDGQGMPETPCEGCRKLGVECTFDYVKKKPGRKNNFLLSLQRGVDESPAPGLFVPSFPGPSMQLDPFATPAPLSSSFTFNADAFPAPALDTGAGSLDWFNEILAGFAPTPLPLPDPSAGAPAGAFEAVNALPPVPGLWPSDQAHLLNLESPDNWLGASTSSNPSTTPGQAQHRPPYIPSPHVPAPKAGVRVEPQIEDVTSWSNIHYFISLFLKYLYPLLPLVHKPTFSEQLVMRRDKTDTDFRALLLSIVAYVISQLPTPRLVNEQYDLEGLKRLQRRCHRTCKSLQRAYYGRTNLTQITTIVFDSFYLLSIGLSDTAGARLGQGVQLAFSMNLHSDEETAKLGLNDIEVQLRRRVFWQLYATDKTRAIPGPPMLITDFQGTPSLPSCTDDEFITTIGTFPQPPARTSLLCGFVAVSKIFQVLSECFFHYRWRTTGRPGMINMEWTIRAESRIHAILSELPPVIQDPDILEGGGEGLKEVFGMQRANVLITAAITKFALFDLRAALNVDKDQLVRERQAIAREIHQLLMNIPKEDLASNGESVRGKIFHIACALCKQLPNAEGTDQAIDSQDQELIKDWFNMFWTISFIQMPPPPMETAMDSRAASPMGIEITTRDTLQGT